MNKVTAIMPVRNEDWILGLSVRALLLWCDEVVVFNHASTDRTLEILYQIQAENKRLHFFSGTDAVWKEMEHRQRLLESARERGATHIVTIDADEVLTATMLPMIRPTILAMPSGRILQLPWLQLRGGIDRVINSGMWASNKASTAFVDQPQWHWAQQTGGYEHHHRHPMGMPLVPHLVSALTHPMMHCGGMQGYGLMHLQMASRRRLAAKQALYVMTETLRWPGRKTATQLNAMYGPTVHTENAADATVPAAWWAGYEDLMQHLDLNAEPWQEAEVKRLWWKGAEKFAGLDLFGVIDGCRG